MGEGGSQIINPCNFTPEQGVKLRLLLERSESKNIRVWYPSETYYLKHSFRGVVKRIPIQLTHAIVHRARENPITHEQENRYSVYSEGYSFSGGSYAGMFDVLGTLAADRGNGLKFKSHKSRAFKIQPFGDNGALAVEKISGSSSKKILSKPEIAKESQLCERARHLHAKKVVFDDAVGLSFILMEKFSGVRLKDILEKWGLNPAGSANDIIDIDRRLQLYYLLLEAVSEQIHSQGIIHRDLKPENIMVDEKHLDIKVIDFGLSRDINEKDNAKCGTDCYAPPEAFDGSDSLKSDIYSLGMMLGLVLGGEFDKTETRKSNSHPSGYDMPKIIALFKHLTGTLSNQEKDDIQQLLDSMTAMDVSARPDIKSVMHDIDTILLRIRLTKVPEQYHEVFSAVHQRAMHVRQILKTPQITFERSVAELKYALASVSEQGSCVTEFINTLRMKSFSEMTKKSDIQQKLTAVTEDYGLICHQLNYLRSQSAITMKAIKRSLEHSVDLVVNNSVLREKLAERLTFLDEDVRLIQYKLHKHESNFDELTRVLAMANKTIVRLNQDFGQIHTDLSALRFSEKELRQRLVINSAPVTILDNLRNQFRAKLSEYLNMSGILNSSPSLFRNIPPQERVRDMHEILDIIDNAQDASDLRELLQEKLNTLNVGATGRSRLRYNIEPLLKMLTSGNQLVQAYA